MMKINGIEYECNEKDFEYFELKKDGRQVVEYLKIKFKGEFKDSNNNLYIEYKDKRYFGYKTLPRYHDGYTTTNVYLYQKGDSELV